MAPQVLVLFDVDGTLTAPRKVCAGRFINAGSSCNDELFIAAVHTGDARVPPGAEEGEVQGPR